MRAIPTTEQADWQAYARHGDAAARERLIERHLPLVRYFARRVQPWAVAEELEELVSAGTIGLLTAVDSFRPDLGYRFSTFAAPRIRGAILDELRRRDVAPRSVRSRQRRVKRTEERLSVELDRSPHHDEVAAVLGVDSATLWGWKADEARGVSVSLDAAAGGNGKVAREMELRDVLGDEWSQELEDRLTQEQEMSRLRVEMEALDERERLVLRLYDFRDMKLREIAELLNVTESRVSQIRTRAIGRLRSRMRHMRDRAAA